VEPDVLQQDEHHEGELELLRTRLLQILLPDLLEVDVN